MVTQGKGWDIQYSVGSGVNIMKSCFNTDSTSLFIGGTITNTNLMSTHTMIAKSDLSGNIIWNRLVAVGDYNISEVVSSPGDYVYVIENALNTSGQRITKWDGAGNLVWQREYTNFGNFHISFNCSAFSTQKNMIGLGGVRTDMTTYRWYPIILEIDTAGNVVQSYWYDHPLYESDFSGIYASPNNGWMVRMNKLTAVVNQNDGWRIGLAELDNLDNMVFNRFFLNWSVHYLDKYNYIKTKDGGYAFMGYDANYNAYLAKTDATGNDTCQSITIAYTQTPQLINSVISNPVVESAQVTNLQPVLVQHSYNISATVLCIDSIPDFTGVDDLSDTGLGVSLIHNPVSAGAPLLLVSNSYDRIPMDMYDVTGNKIMEAELVKGENLFNTDNLANGVYFLVLTQSEKRKSFKFLVHR